MRYRIFDASCIACLRTELEARRPTSARSSTTASAPISPFFVPPNETRVDAGVGGQRAQRHAERRGRVAEPRAVDVQQQPVPVRPVGERRDLLGRVDRPELGALRDRDDPRLDDVLVADAREQRLDQLRRQLAVGRVDGQQLAAARSGAPHSSTCRCAVRAQTTASHGCVSASMHSTLAPVPLNTGNARAAGPKCSRKRCCGAVGPRIVRRRRRRARGWRRRSRPAPRDGRRRGCRWRSRCVRAFLGSRRNRATQDEWLGAINIGY